MNYSTCTAIRTIRFSAQPFGNVENELYYNYENHACQSLAFTLNKTTHLLIKNTVLQKKNDNCTVRIENQTELCVPCGCRWSRAPRTILHRKRPLIFPEFSVHFPKSHINFSGIFRNLINQRNFATIIFILSEYTKIKKIPDTPMKHPVLTCVRSCSENNIKIMSSNENNS